MLATACGGKLIVFARNSNPGPVQWHCFPQTDLSSQVGVVLLVTKSFVCIFQTDLRTMTERLKSGYFSSKKLFIADMMRIFTNCRTYNAPDTEYYKCANTVERFFLSKVKELRKGWAQLEKLQLFSALLRCKKRKRKTKKKITPCVNKCNEINVHVYICIWSVGYRRSSQVILVLQ